MLRYLALIWDARDQRQSAQAHGLAHRVLTSARQWKESFHLEGVRVFCAGAASDAARIHTLGKRHGVVIGTLFERNLDIEDDTPSRPATIDAQQAELIARSQGRRLISHYWGNYVAFIADANTGAIRALKDPTGSLPCYYTVHRDIGVIFSCVADVLGIGAVAPVVDRDYLRMRVISSGTTVQRDALGGVLQIHRGECVEIDPKQQNSPLRRNHYWSPLNFSGSQDVLDDPDRAAYGLRATVRACTLSWVACHDSLLHRLSGGLDSSIIISCLKDRAERHHVFCYTYYNPQSRSDERPWARLAAKSADCTHLELPTSPADIDLATMLRMEASVEPTQAMSHVLRTLVERPLAEDQRATAVLCGDGGDSGFCSDSLAYVVPEYLRHTGPRAELFRLASQVALSTDRSTWNVLLRAIRETAGRRDTRQFRQAAIAGSRLVSRDLCESLDIEEQRMHPWFLEIRPTPWAVVRRLGPLLCTPDCYNGLPAEDAIPEVIAPLCSQPAVELFLRIPTYRHFEGRDRGLARRAFATDVPVEILRRTWKDRAPGFLDELIRRNRKLLRELFLDGVLVTEGLLDRVAVEAALSSSLRKSTVLPGEIFRHLDVELWARHWLRRTRQYAAA
jgi:asparagine synthase (glutamine-hydrolysing)